MRLAEDANVPVVFLKNELAVVLNFCISTAGELSSSVALGEVSNSSGGSNCYLRITFFLL